jgi:PAS domain S-box-containing protein
VRADLDTNLLEEVPDAVIATARDGRILYWNKASESIFGYSSEEASGRMLAELMLPPDRLEEERRVVEEAMSTGMASFETLRRRKDGAFVYIDASCKAIYDEGGQVRFLLYCKKDVTHLKVRRDARLVEARFRDLFESVPDGIIMVNPSGHIVLANSRAEAMFAYEHGALRGAPVEMLLPERLRATHIRHRADYTAQPRMRAMGAGLQLHGLRSDGSEFPVEISLSPLQAEDETFVLSAIRNLSDRKRIETELREMNLELERASRAKDSFLASISHELRTPLNAIIGFTGALLMKLQGPLNAEQERHLRMVQASATHLLSLINDLLDVAKIGAGKAELRAEPTACRHVVQEVVDWLRPQAEAKGLALELAGAAEDEVMTMTDRRALRQIVFNLVGNAIKFTERGSVRVRLDASIDDKVRIEVEDSGVGIAPELQPGLFEPFSRAGSESRRRGEGTGLGLFVSRRLAQLLGGHIEVRSAPDSGSLFSLVVPRQWA